MKNRFLSLGAAVVLAWLPLAAQTTPAGAAGATDEKARFQIPATDEGLPGAPMNGGE